MEKDLIEYIAKSIVDNPSAVSVSVEEKETVTLLELKAAPEDTGKLIGKGGRIAKALRTVLQAAAVKSGKHPVLEIID
ncbi:MAG: KH domain-containing protein [Treponema sp.]|jgi:predicted RNA-binding protein YlqC (UPF0109 family)|nr:KH domain-containing protein [Treponema sp.]